MDNGGLEGVIDDIFEIDVDGAGIDDLAETRPSKPFGDDTPPGFRDNLQRIPGMDQPIGNSPDSPTVFQLLERYITVKSTFDRQLQETKLDQKGNRKKLNPNLILQQTPELSRRPVSYLFPLAGLDNDGDWGTDPLDDDNKNHIPDGDWDGSAEITSGEKANNIDDDYDGKVDDDGDDNGDGIVTYDPEGGVDEDRPTYAGVEDSDRITSPSVLDEFGDDKIDNNSNRDRWMSDGIDNDGDGLTDETFLDEMQDPVLKKSMEDARDEGVDEPGEWYVGRRVGKTNQGSGKSLSTRWTRTRLTSSLSRTWPTRWITASPPSGMTAPPRSSSARSKRMVPPMWWRLGATKPCVLPRSWPDR